MAIRPPTRARLGDEAAYTLIELIVVMAIMVIVLVGLTTSFVGGTSAEVDVTVRQEAEQTARLALTRMRDDIHCSNAVASVAANDVGGFTLSLTETDGVCATVEPSDGQSGAKVLLTWCTVPDPANPGTFLLYRDPGATDTACDSTSATLEAQYITAPASGWPQNEALTGANPAGNIWPTARACPTGYLPTVAVDMAIDPQPTRTLEPTYELVDEIALRDASACT